MTNRKIPLWNINNEIVDYAYVSYEDYDNVNQYRWNLYKTINKKTKKETKYATGYISTDEQCVKMHHLIIGKPKTKDEVIDHRDRNGLNNMRENLRFATLSQNAQNKDSIKTEKSDSKYFGVTKVPCNNKWRAGALNIYLGTFDTEIEAAIMYDKYSYLVYGDGAMTNRLITYDEVKDLNLDELIKSVKQARNERKLPANVTWFQDKYYRVRVTYNKKEYSVGYYKSIEEAVKARDEFKEKINKVNDKIDVAHNDREILRNNDGYAIIPTKNDKGEINGAAIVDDDKWYNLMKYSWNLDQHGYVIGRIDSQLVCMHMILMNKDDQDDRIIDHTNGIKFDNRLSNIRLATDSENSHNKDKKLGTLSKYYGVSKNRNRWFAHITIKRKMIRLGYFDTEDEAAIVYNEKAKELYKEFARLNVIGESSVKPKLKAPEINIENIKEKLKDHKDIVNEIKSAAVLKDQRERINKYRGVTKTYNQFAAAIQKDKKEYYLGVYSTEDDAARAYNMKAKELFGDQAKLNPIEGEVEIVGHVGKSSKYRGVSYNNKFNNWKVVLRKDGKAIHAGTFPTEKEAALAYNEAAQKHHGTKAKLNIITEE